MRFTLRAKSVLLGCLLGAVNYTAAAAQVGIAPAPVPTSVRNFQMLTYNSVNPVAGSLQYSHSSPGRTMTETVVDNVGEFDQRLYAIPNGVNLTTEMDILFQRHSEFQNLVANNEMLITVAIHGDLKDLESFALDSLGFAQIGRRFVAPGSTDGMLLIQYYQKFNTAALLGSETYIQGRRATYPSEYPLVRTANSAANLRTANSAADKGIVGDIGIYILIRIIKAALEEPFWNDVHYLSGQTLGCLGVDWTTAFKILYKWEMFEQWINGVGAAMGQNWNVGEDIWGIIWDLIWGMTGYIDGVLGWWD